VDPTVRYLELARRGRERFLAEAAPAALVRRRAEPAAPERTASGTHDGEDAEETRVERTFVGPGPVVTAGDVDIFPVAKKPGAPFSELITVGRTANNDVVINHITVSRFHAYFRQAEQRWYVSDGGSRNGTRVDGVKLEARRERAVETGTQVQIGDVEATFFTAPALFDLLSLAARMS
jgi:hypothetical protein